MEVWTIEWSCPSDGDGDVTIWATEEDALKAACREIGNHIQSTFDFDLVSDASCAEDFNDLVRNGQLRDAIRRYNDHQDDYNQDYANYWFVQKKPVLTGDGKTSVSSSANLSFSSNGATCRGPCKQHNEYANADKADGTYVCRQCKTFQHIFSGSP
jgi:hypothetical protein